MSLHDVSAVLLLAFAAVGVFDGIYLHLWRFQLHLRPGSQREHLTHTLRALLFPPVLVLVLAGNTGGLLLWAGVLLVLLDQAVAVWDVRTEPRSRAFQGGLPRHEFVVHVVATVLHVGALAASLLARPTAAWGLGSPWILDAPAASRAWALAWQGLLPGTVVLGALHVVASRLPSLFPRAGLACRLCARPA